MTDTPPGSTLTAAPKDSSAQTIVALAIAGGLTVLGAGAIVAAVLVHDIAATCFTVVGTAIGALATALNAPSGIASVIASARKGGQS